MIPFLKSAMATGLSLLIATIFVGCTRESQKDTLPANSSTSKNVEGKGSFGSPNPSPDISIANTPEQANPLESNYLINNVSVTISGKDMYPKGKYSAEEPPPASTQWAFVRFRLTNNGKEPVVAGAEGTTVSDNQGHQYRLSDAYMDYTDEIKPGFSIDGTLVFDVPEALNRLANMTLYIREEGAFGTSVAAPTVPLA